MKDLTTTPSKVIIMHKTISSRRKYAHQSSLINVIIGRLQNKIITITLNFRKIRDAPESLFIKKNLRIDLF